MLFGIFHRCGGTITFPVLLARRSLLLGITNRDVGKNLDQLRFFGLDIRAVVLSTVIFIGDGSSKR